jgi:hypothetical protein
MNMSRVPIILVGAVLVFSSGAIAGETNKARLHLAETITVEGKAVSPGDYTVEWTGSGPAVEVNLLRGKQTVATFPAHVTEEPSANATDAYTSRAGLNGSRTLTAIYVGGKKTTLELDKSEAAPQANHPGAK